MSLVHEALQKAEREKRRKAGVPPTAPVHVATTSPIVHTPPVHTPTDHGPAPSAPFLPLGRESVAQEIAPTAPESTKTNSYLLPALIGCVALVAIIAIVFLVANAASVVRQSKEIAAAHAATPAPAPAPVVASAPVAMANPSEPAQPQPVVQSPAQPTAPPTAPSPAATAADESKYKLSGIMTDPDGKFVAVLNGRVAYEGYYIDGATVKKIERDRVTIDDHGREAVLRLF